MPMIRGIIGTRHSGVSVRRGLTLRNAAKGAGAVVLGLIALDLVATIATLAFVGIMRR
ncbi:hypothetical protein ACUXST_001462 [Sphingomonas sp. F9_3S_D5_B_2]